MEFNYNINDIFKSPIVEVNHSLIPPGYTGDRRALRDVVSKVSEIVNAMGEASAAAQGLSKPITTADRLRNSEHKLYFLIDPNGNGSKGAVTGMLKTGNKSLYVFDRDGVHYQVSPPCLLDFYIHESRQRNGLGKKLFEHMLQKEKIEPVQMAVDRPSEKLLSFLTKHYSLKEPVKQMNNYVVYDGFFPSKEPVSQTPDVDEARSTSDCKKNSANGLQYFQAPMGRYGAPRPPCSMGQIIHNQSPTIEQRQEPTGVQSMPATNCQDANFSPQTNAHETKSAPNTYFGNYPANQNQYQTRSMTNQNWQQDPAFQTYSTNNLPYSDPTQLPHVNYQTQNYSVPNIPYQSTYGQNLQGNAFGHYSHFIPAQASQSFQMNTTGQPAQTRQTSQINMIGQPAQINATEQPVQINTTGQPSQMNMAGQAAQMNLARQPAQMNTMGQPAQMNAMGQPAPINMTGQHAQMNMAGQHAQMTTAGQHAQMNMAGQPSPMNMTGQTYPMNMTGQPAQMNMTGQLPQVNMNGQPSQMHTTGQPFTNVNVEPPTNMDAVRAQMYNAAQPVQMAGYQYQPPGSESWIAKDNRDMQVGQQYPTPTSFANRVSSSKQKLSNGMDLPEPKPESKSKLLKQQQQHQEGIVSSNAYVGQVQNITPFTIAKRQEPLISYSQNSRIPEQPIQHQLLPHTHPHLTQSAVYPVVSGQHSSVQGFPMPHIAHTTPNLNIQQYMTGTAPSAPYVNQVMNQHSQPVSRIQTPAPSVQQIANQPQIVQNNEQENVMGAGEPKQFHQPVVEPQHQMYYPQSQGAEAGDFKQQAPSQMIPSKATASVRHQNVKPVASKTDLTPNNSQPNYVTPPGPEYAEQNYPYPAYSAERNNQNLTQPNYQDQSPNYHDQQNVQYQPVTPPHSEHNSIQQNSPNQMYLQNQPIVNAVEESQPSFHMTNSDVNSPQLNRIQNSQTPENVLLHQNFQHPSTSQAGGQQGPFSTQPYFHQSNTGYHNQPHFQQANPVQQTFHLPQSPQQNTPSLSQIHQNQLANTIQQVEPVKSVPIINMNQGDHAQQGIPSNPLGHADQTYVVNQAGDYIVQQNQGTEKELPKRRVPSAAELFKTNNSDVQTARTKAKAKRYYNKLTQPSECELTYGYPPQINESRMSFIRQRS